MLGAFDGRHRNVDLRDPERYQASNMEERYQHRVYRDSPYRNPRLEHRSEFGKLVIKMLLWEQKSDYAFSSCYFWLNIMKIALRFENANLENSNYSGII